MKTSDPFSERWGAASRPRTLVVAAALVVVVSYASFMFSQRVVPAFTDTLADWLTVNAAVEGMDPWADLRDLADAFDVRFLLLGGEELSDDESFVHPRTPGALLLLSPMRFATSDSVYPLFAALIGVSYLAGLAVVGRRSSALSSDRVVMLGLLGVPTVAYLSTLQYGTHSSLLFLCLAISWVSLSKGDGVGAGIAVGVAGVLRLFPLLLLIPMWMNGRRKACVSAMVVFVAVNAVGLVVFDLSVIDSLAALSTASETWMAFTGNGSLGMPLTKMGMPVTAASVLLVVLSGLIAVGFSKKSKTLEQVIGPVVLVSVLFSPLSWEHYDLLVLLAVWFAIGQLARPWWRDPAGVLIGLWFLLQFSSTSISAVISPPGYTISGPISILGRVVALSALVILWRRGLRGDLRSGSVAPQVL